MNDDQWLPEEEARLRAARVPIAPPPGEEERLVAALRARGLLRARFLKGPFVWTAAAVVIAVILGLLWLIRNTAGI